MLVSCLAYQTWFQTMFVKGQMLALLSSVLSDKHKHKLWLIGRLWSVFYGVLTTLND